MHSWLRDVKQEARVLTIWGKTDRPSGPEPLVHITLTLDLVSKILLRSNGTSSQVFMYSQCKGIPIVILGFIDMHDKQVSKRFGAYISAHRGTITSDLG